MESNEQKDLTVASCDSRLSRKEFLKRVLGPVVATGAILAAPKIVDKFILPAEAIPANASHRPGVIGKSGWGGWR